jgi:hypothetical protein
MTDTTRDNIIYLTVGLTIAILVAGDFVVADHRGTEMWWPTSLQFHAASYWFVLSYFIATETRKITSSVVQIIICEFIGAVLHVGVVLMFHDTLARPLGLRLFAIAIIEFFVIVEIARQVVRRLKLYRR